MVSQRIILISIPFWRIAKVVLNPELLRNLSQHGSKIVVITPLDLNEIKSEFANTYPFEVINFVPNLDSKLVNLLYSITEILRMNGYWFKFRKREMKYYAKNMFREFSISGQDLNKPILNRIALFILSYFGSMRLWDKFDFLLRKYYKYPEALNKYVEGIAKIYFIQCASWGLQDRMLASWANKHSVDGFLLPYTTDQIIMNGFLLMNYKKIFLQGPLEKFYAEKLQGCKSTSLYEAGSLWLRYVDDILKPIQIAKREKCKKVKIVYAGVSPLYYPRIAEFKVIETISSFLSSNYNIDDIEFTYRPYITDESDKFAVMNNLIHLKNVLFQWPKYSVNNLSELSSESFFDDIKSEVLHIMDINIFIMSVSTSMAIDVSYVSGATIISNMIDHEDILARRNTHLIVDNDTLKFVPGAKVVYNHNELNDAIKKVIDTHCEADGSSKTILSSWDYQNVDFPKNINQLLDLP